jgi:hypothetical protein
MKLNGDKMNKKILIGSIIALCILVCVSFTSVVGYRSMESGVNASPLFNIRTSRAINEKTSIQTCDYVGKGEDAGIPIPERNTTYVILSEVIQRINKMDEEDINKLIDFIKAHQDDISGYIKNLDNNKNFDVNEIKKVMNDFNKGNFTSNLFNPLCFVIQLILSAIFWSVAIVWVGLFISILIIVLSPFIIVSVLARCTSNWFCVP